MKNKTDRQRTHEAIGTITVVFLLGALGAYYCVTLFTDHLFLSLICGFFALCAVVVATAMAVKAFGGAQRAATKVEHQKTPAWIGILLCAWLAAQIAGSIGAYKLVGTWGDNVDDVGGALFVCAEAVSVLIIAIGCYATFKLKIESAAWLFAVPFLGAIAGFCLFIVCAIISGDDINASNAFFRFLMCAGFVPMLPFLLAIAPFLLAIVIAIAVFSTALDSVRNFTSSFFTKSDKDK